MLRKLVLLCALGVATVLGISDRAFAAATCDTLLPGPQREAATGPVTPEILAKLRDAGPIYPYQVDRPILSLSPDKASAAFEIHRGDPSDDSYCVGILIVPLEPGAKPYLVDVGHELILDSHPSNGWAAFQSGVPLPITPRWSPDGRGLTFLKRVGRSTQVWRVDLASKSAHQLTWSASDVDDFRLAGDGRTLIYATRPALASNQIAVDREGMTGWHVDSRVMPARGVRPQTPNAQTRYLSLDIATGEERTASSGEAALFEPPAGTPKNAAAYALDPHGRQAWIEAVDPAVYPSTYDLVVETAGRREVCKASKCRPYQMTRLWWSEDGKRLRFTRREGWADSQTAIYDWIPGRGAPRRIYRTRDDLAECHARGNDLICLRDGSIKPRRLVLLGLDGGPEKTLFSTNPEFANLALGRVERQEWLSATGVPFYGDLVYPTNYIPGRRFPMVVVQYRARGFIRGGVGDEMPIQTFANRGYFVFVFDIGSEAAMVGPQASELKQQVALNRDLIGLKHVLSGIETITRSLIDKGLVDRTRIGIHGLSAGSSTVQMAAINSALFSAGSVSGCCWEPSQDVSLGAAIADGYHQQGWPKMTDQASAFWSQISIMQQPAHTKFPILFQAADNEYLGALGSFTALSQAAMPADMFVFPDEYHLKWHPAHRLAVYKRNLAWFDFWLKGQISKDPREQAEAARWIEMRQKLRPSTALTQ